MSLSDLFGPQKADITSVEKNEYIKEVQATVDNYIPKIFERTGWDLGPVPVKEYSQIPKDAANVLYYQIVGKGKKESPIIKRIIGQGISDCLYRPIIAIMGKFIEDFQWAIYSNESIYVSLTHSNWPRINNSIRGKKTSLDQDVIHLLAHCFWEKAGGEIPDNHLKESMYEGFANYWELWFSDLYPYNKKIAESRPDFHIEGMKKVDEFVKKYGEENIILIPISNLRDTNKMETNGTRIKK